MHEVDAEQANKSLVHASRARTPRAQSQLTNCFPTHPKWVERSRTSNAGQLTEPSRALPSSALWGADVEE
eukprot:8454722-Alexandrium_andersonii.AAC.1